MKSLMGRNLAFVSFAASVIVFGGIYAALRSPSPAGDAPAPSASNEPASIAGAEATPDPACGEFDPAWLACRADDDCEARFNECGWVEVHNKTSKAQVEAFTVCLTGSMKCAEAMEGQEKPIYRGKPVCERGLCALPEAESGEARGHQ